MRAGWLTPILATYAVWAVYLVSWSIAAFWAAPTVKRPIGLLAILDRILFLVGFVLLLDLFRVREAAQRDSTLPDEVAWALVGVAGFGIGFCWWARLHLGRLWSTMITRKEGHRIVDTGPYALVRHPIYAGLLLTIFATAAQRATPLAFAGAGLLFVALLLRVWREERFLSEELGAEAYAAYRARVPALVPFLPR
jgi:protein-S-isoprenylcysteine O-methyltransferase Ste14